MSEPPNLAGHEQKTMIQSDIIGQEIDLIIRFEDLGEGFAKLCKQLGIDRELPHIRTGNSLIRQHYSMLYNEKLAGVVADMFGKDIERFDYAFTPPGAALRIGSITSHSDE